MPTRRLSINQILNEIREMRTIEMFQTQEEFVRRNLTEIANAIEQSTREMVQLIQGTHPRYRRIIESLREGARPVGLGGWTDQRLLNVLDSIDSLARDIELSTGEQMLRGSSAIARDIYTNYPDILSFGNRIPSFSSVELSMSQVRALVEDTSVGGVGMQRFMNRMFNTYTQEDIRNELFVGALQGEGIPKLTRRIKDKYEWLDQTQINRIIAQGEKRGLVGEKLTNFIAKKSEQVIRQNAITTARTHMQTVANDSMSRVYRENEDIIKEYEWNATMEPGYTISGRGTCSRCAALDGERYEREEDMPEVPLHPNCRCVKLPITKSWKELGMSRSDVNGIINQYRPYVIRESDAEIVRGRGRAVGAGGRRILGSVGRGPNRSYAEWYEDRNNFFKMNVVGPSRAKWLQEGSRRSIRDLVDRNTGEWIRLEDLPGSPTPITRAQYIREYGTVEEKRQL